MKIDGRDEPNLRGGRGGVTGQKVETMRTTIGCIFLLARKIIETLDLPQPTQILKRVIIYNLA